MNLWRKNKTKIFLIKFSFFNFSLTKIINETIMELKISSLLMQDTYSEYRFPELGYFCSSDPFSSNFHTNIKKNDAISVEIHFLEGEKETKIAVNFHEFYINWKPALLSAIMSFLLKNDNQYNKNDFKKDESLINRKGSISASRKLSSSSSQKEKNNINDSKTKITISFQKLTLYMVANSIIISKLKCKYIHFDILMQSEQILIDGNIANLKIYETTDYPQTNLSFDYNEKLKFYKLLSYSNAKRRCSFSLNATFYDSKFPVDSNIYNIIRIELKNLKLEYIQQPLLRVIDFFNQQILGVLTADYSKNEREKLDLSKILQNIRDPKFTSIQVCIKEVELILKALPLLDEKISIHFSEIIVRNKAKINIDRIKDSKLELNGIWVDNMYVFLKDGIIEKDKKFERLSTFFNVGIKIERVLMSEELEKLGVNMDSSMKIKIRIEGLKLKLLKSDYLFLMKIVFNNVTFDDFCDEFIYEKNIPSEFENDSNKKGSNKIFFPFFLKVLLFRYNVNLSFVFSSFFNVL